jgi:transcriptional regulator GlxA family with amidase domain
MSVRNLAVILDVSERTLEYAFHDQFDISPRAFLINYRLHQARKSLLSSDPGESTVAMVAAENGFFDFGRFAAKYRQLFGENPSVTLHRPN